MQTQMTASQANDKANAHAAVMAAKNAKREAENWAEISKIREQKKEEARIALERKTRIQAAFLEACEDNRKAEAELKEWDHATEQAKERAGSAAAAVAEWVKIVPESLLLAEMANHA